MYKEVIRFLRSKNGGRLALLVLVAVVGLVIAKMQRADDSFLKKAEADHIVNVEANDPVMLRAFAMARAGLDEFLPLAADPPRNLDLFALKVRITDGPKVEYFWVSPFSPLGNTFEGTINNDPAVVSPVHIGQRYQFSRDDIVDWTYFDNDAKKTYGIFTACAPLTHETVEEAAKFRATYGLTCTL